MRLSDAFIVKMATKRCQYPTSATKTGCEKEESGLSPFLAQWLINSLAQNAQRCFLNVKN
jgi:hypothetical protein